MAFDAIAERQIGQFPLSIATSLALESANGTHPEMQVDRAPLLAYREFWVNIRTLFRNLLGAMDKDAAGLAKPQPLAEAIIQEMDVIARIAADATHGMTQVVFYVSEYADIEHKYSNATVRRDNTDRQKEYTENQNQTIQYILDHTTNSEAYKVLVFDLKLKPTTQANTLIMTHYPFDLVSYKNFSDLVLLESHTGAIKKRALWNTKYMNGKDLSMIPFNEGFLQIFGDAETFRPMDIRLRRDLVELATKHRWNATTTLEKIRYNLNSMPNKFAAEVVKKILV